MTSTPTPHLQAEYWNGDEAARWLTHEDRYESMLAPFTPRLLAAAAVSGSNRVLDIGCGCGATTRAAARAASGARHSAWISLKPCSVGRWNTPRRKVSPTSASSRLTPRCTRFPKQALEVVVSRFGVMFFTDPGAAFARSFTRARPGGRLAFVCWRGALENEWITVPGLAVAEHVAVPAFGDAGGPGPFSLADEARVRAVLATAGCEAVDVRPMAEPLLFGGDPADTVAFLKDTGMGRAALQGEDPATVGRATRALQSALEPYQTPDGIRVGSAAWLVTARRPA